MKDLHGAWPRVEAPTVFTVWREYDHGGHFAAWECPEDYLWGLRTALNL